jgi:tRNA G46 methylase TrmB
VLRLAKSSPGALFIGVDTNAAGLSEVSRKAARGGGGNAVFVVADAMDALGALRGRVDVLSITLPWGSLLRRVLEGERQFALAVAGAL